MNHTSTVLEPSIPFQTLFELVDAEDIANDEFRTHDLTLEVVSITNQLKSQNVDIQQSEQLLFTQPRDLSHKHKRVCKKYKKNHRTIHSISACFKKQRTDEHQRDAHARTKFLKNLLNIILVLLLVIIRTRTKLPINLMTLQIDSAAQVHHAIVIQIETPHHETNIAPILELDTNMKDKLRKTKNPQYNSSRD